MADDKLNRRERIVLGVYGVGTLMLGTAMTANIPLNVAGRMVPPDQLASLIAVVAGLGTVAASVFLSVRFFGSKPGLKLMLREAWAGLLAGVVAGFLLGFAIGALLPGAARLLGLVGLYAAGIALTMWFANRAEAA